MSPQSLELLLVEDNEDDIILLQEALAEHPQVVVKHIARDGEEALKYLQEQSRPEASDALPDLILLDINMPRMNGFEVLQEIKKNQEWLHIPVVMLTTSTRDDDILQAHQYGAASYICKPSSFDTLLQFVENFIIYWTTVAKIPKAKSLHDIL